MPLSGVTLEQCRMACVSVPACEGIIYTNKSTCWGKREIRTSACQPADGLHILEVIRGPPQGKCSIFGDPHILSFDRIYGPPISLVDTGMWWLIKSEQLKIQGRFGYTRRFPKATSLVGFAATGSRMKNHKLACMYVGPEMGPSGYRVFWDGKRILEGFPSEYAAIDGSMHGKHSNINLSKNRSTERHTIGDTSTEQRSFFFVFDNSFRIDVLLGPDNVNMIIHMQKLDGMDGLCGNFNCNQEDDLLNWLEKRGMSSPIPDTQSLFRGLPTPPDWVTEQREDFDVSECDPAVRYRAEKDCLKVNHGERMACIYDACAEDRAAAVEVGGPAATAVLAMTDLPHDCSIGTPKAWNDTKEAWCCAYQQKCRPVSGAAVEPCNSQCLYLGKIATCNARILWAAMRTDTGRPTTCAIAHTLVLDKCDVCKGCELQKTRCNDLWKHKHYYRRYSPIEKPLVEQRLPVSRFINPKLLAIVLMAGFAMAAAGGMAVRSVCGSGRHRQCGYSDARFFDAKCSRRRALWQSFLTL
jgi:hypothetical protein